MTDLPLPPGSAAPPNPPRRIFRFGNAARFAKTAPVDPET
jgi:hypothetical protein